MGRWPVAKSRRSLRSLESRLVWIFGSPRSGSTWLFGLLRSLDGVAGLNEPLIGAHLGVPQDALVGVDATTPAAASAWRASDHGHERDDYFFSDAYDSAWVPDLRRLVLRRLAAQVSADRKAHGRRSDRIVIKEPHGSQAADLIMRLCPRSTLIFLLRDGRDVVDSELDATEPGSWAMSQLSGYARGDRLSFLRSRSVAWLARTEIVQAAYEAQPADRRAFLRYEDLLANTEATLTPLLAQLGLAVDPTQLEDLIARLGFESSPAEGRGSGQFVRAATPGLWRERMSPEEISAMSEILQPKLDELGYD